MRTEFHRGPSLPLMPAALYTNYHNRLRKPIERMIPSGSTARTIRGQRLGYGGQAMRDPRIAMLLMAARSSRPTLALLGGLLNILGAARAGGVQVVARPWRDHVALAAIQAIAEAAHTRRLPDVATHLGGCLKR
jgi:hypothetical protein